MEYVPPVVSFLSIIVGIVLAIVYARWIMKMIVNAFATPTQRIEFSEDVPADLRKRYTPAIRYYAREINEIIHKQTRVKPNLPTVLVTNENATYTYNGIGSINHETGDRITERTNKRLNRNVDVEEKDSSLVITIHRRS